MRDTCSALFPLGLHLTAPILDQFVNETDTLRHEFSHKGLHSARHSVPRQQLNFVVLNSRKQNVAFPQAQRLDEGRGYDERPVGANADLRMRLVRSSHGDQSAEK